MLSKSNIALKPLGTFDSQSHKINHGDHLCEFYSDSQALADSVCDYVVPGITRGDGVILIATAENLTKFQEILERRSIDVHRAKSVGKLLMLDAHDMLAKFMVNGSPDSEKFHKTIGELIKDFKDKYPCIRAFGEMVNILWEENNLAGAIRLEELWTELNAKYHFSLLCGYSDKKFRKKMNVEALKAICATHTHMISNGQLCLNPERL